MLARIRKSMEEKDRGFTLIELLVVMIIIGILAAIAIPVFLNQQKKAHDTSVKSDLRTIANDVSTDYVDAQTYPGAAVNTWYGAGSTASGTGALYTTDTVTAGNTISYLKMTDGTGFCLRGFSSAGNATSASNAYYWVSTTGGLVSTAQTNAPGVCK